MKPGMGRLTLDLPLETLKRLKIVSALQNKSMKDILLPLIESKLEGLKVKSDTK